MKKKKKTGTKSKFVSFSFLEKNLPSFYLKRKKSHDWQEKDVFLYFYSVQNYQKEGEFNIPNLSTVFKRGITRIQFIYLN